MDYQKRDLDAKVGYDGLKRQRTEAGPSKVLHVRALPPYCTENELTSMMAPYGTVTRVLLLNQKQQAFVQMGSVDAARSVVTQFGQTGVQLRGKTVYVQFSSRQEVQVPTGGGDGGSGAGGGAPSHILIVSILNARVPVTIDNIHEVFKVYGEVKKIITFVKEGMFKAFVQMGSVEAAMNARMNLEGKDMFQGCCSLRIGFSKLRELNVKQDGPKSRDFSRAYGAGGGGGGGAGPGLFSPYGQPAQPQYLMQQPQGMPGMGGMMGGMGGGMGGMEVPGMDSRPQSGAVLLVNNLPEGFTADNIFILFGVYGDVMRVKILYNKRDTAMVQFSTQQQAQQARTNLNDLMIAGKELKASTSKHMEVSLPRGEQDAESSELTKDFSSSPIHRFKHRGSRNTKNIHPPSQVLHISNLPEGTTEDDLRKLFGAQSTAPAKAQFFKNDRKMAFVRLNSTEEGALALIRLHNFKFKERYMRVSFSSKDQSAIQDTDGMEMGSASAAAGAV